MLSESSLSPGLEKQSRILVIGEYEVLNTFLTMALTDLGQCQVACVSSGIQALHVAPAHVPDLLLIDFNLQHLNGFQLHEQLHTQPVLEQIPTILLNTDLDFPKRDDPRLFCLQEAFDLDELLFLVKSLLLISDRLRSLH